MRVILFVLLFGSIGQIYARAFDSDTIDNWQIYNGTELVLAGNETGLEIELQGTIKTTELKKLVIQFNHCVHYMEGHNVIIEIRDDKGKHILTKTFKVNADRRIVISKGELGPLTMKSITIRYQEKIKGGIDKILGRIIFV